MHSRPIILGSEKESLIGLASQGSRRPKNPLVNDAPEGPSGLVLVRDDGVKVGRRFEGVPDDNRSSILPDVTAEVDGRGYALCAKGVGARTPLYGESPLDFAFKSDFGARAREVSGGSMASSRMFTRESWFGESPYGAQGEVPATQGLKVTELASGCSIEGFHICPVVEVLELPPELVRGMSGTYWYRRHEGPVLQEHRLVPSNVRLYHQSQVTLGQDPDTVLQAFEIATTPAIDSFIDNYLSSGVAALTLFARTMRECRWGFQGLDYADVWLDKDSVVAQDGTLHFADIEGLDWSVAGQDKSVEARVRDQFDRNFYEFMFGLDVLERRADSLEGKSRGQDVRRESIARRIELAVAGDRFTRTEASKGGLDLVVTPRLGEQREIVIRFVDLR